MKKYDRHMYAVYADIHPRPQAHEISAARLLAKFFRADVYFIEPTNHKTPDLMIAGLLWEIKAPIGAGKYTIEHQLHRAAH